MKLYFAKYLPVEGEINRGDMILIPEGKVEECDEIYESFPEKVGVLNKGYWDITDVKKVKLFLCSRDIQVGEKFRNKEGEEFECKNITEGDGSIYYPKETLIWTWDESDGSVKYWRPSSECYKIIGEISPEATWVKEGDKFTEVEWRSAKRVDVTYVDYEKRVPLDKDYFVEIRCPTCKTFH